MSVMYSSSVCEWLELSQAFILLAPKTRRSREALDIAKQFFNLFLILFVSFENKQKKKKPTLTTAAAVAITT